MYLPRAFDYHYFDDPHASGYRGYHRKPYGDNALEPWEEAADYCVTADVHSVIDLGCGKGFLVEALLTRGIQARGYDVSDYALSFASGLPCHKHDIAHGVPGSADAVVALGVLMYLSRDILKNVLRDIECAALKTFLFSGHYEKDVQMFPDNLRQITESGGWWHEQIRQAGFEHAESKRFFDVFVKRRY